MQIRTRRVREAPGAEDGARILVDALWPRGLSRADARIDDWIRDCAPSKALRQWFGHQPARWDEFRRRYFAELDANPAALDRLRPWLQRDRLTLLFDARETRHNNAVALREYLLEKRD